MTAQDQQSRTAQGDFEAWSIRANQGYDLTKMHSGNMHTYEDDKTEHAWRGFFYGWQAALALPEGMAPGAEVLSSRLGNDTSTIDKAFAAGTKLYTAAQVLAMGRVPPGWQVTEEMHIAAVKVLHRATGLAGLPQRMVDAMLAVAPRPPAAQEGA